MELGSAAAALYGDVRLPPLLHQLLEHSNRLLGAVASSVSLVEAAGDRYEKVAERGVSCQLGHSFALDEGATGQVVTRRRPVVLASYRDLPVRHLPPDAPESTGAVVAVPIWWRGEVIGANVVFAGRRRRFTAGEVDELEALTQMAAAGIVRAGANDPSLLHLIRDHPRTQAAAGVRTVVTEVGQARPVSPAVAAIAVDIVSRAERAAAGGRSEAWLHVGVVHRPEGVRLLLQDESPDLPAGVDPLGAGARSWQELVGRAGGGIEIERVSGWGTLLRIDLPYEPPPAEPAGRPSQLTNREHEVLSLLGRGLSDREVAATLVISRKTVEKHVGAVLRKTGTTSRTAAVVRALELGWLAPDRPA
jgi:DNA-binding CsgD family transcriptional regulator